MQTRIVVYHSYEWGCLVEQGWITDTVEEINGVRIAFMVKP